MRQDLRSRRRQPEPVTRSIEQRETGALLQETQLQSDGGRRDVEFVRRRRHGPRADHGSQGTELLQGNVAHAAFKIFFRSPIRNPNLLMRQDTRESINTTSNRRGPYGRSGYGAAVVRTGAKEFK